MHHLLSSSEHWCQQMFPFIVRTMSRLKDQQEAHMAHIQSTYELRAILQAEQDSQARNRRQMSIEDVSGVLKAIYCCSWRILSAMG